MDWKQLKTHMKTLAPEKGGPVVVAFSGGVDSSVVALAAHEIWDQRFMAVTVDSELVFGHELERARVIAVLKGFHHRFLPMDVLAEERIAANGPDRCYWCKRRIFSAMREIFGENAVLMDGTNADDDPARPGMKAARELGVVSPLRELGIAKEQIRRLARQQGLPNHGKPSNSCIATRVAPGQPLQEKVLAAVESVENHLVAQGVNDLRARVDELMMTIHYPSRHAAIMVNERENVQELIARSVLEGVEFREWQA